MNKKITRTIDERNIAWLVLNNPQRHNAFDDEFIRELIESIQTLSEDPNVRIVVLAANGKSFSAGADLGWMKRSANYSNTENLADARELGKLMDLLYSCAKPTVARVQGAAFGGGVGLVARCDIAIAEESAIFSLSEVRLGLVPAVISPYLVAAMGTRTTKRLTLTAERFSAQGARAYNLVHEVVRTEAGLDNAVKHTCENILMGAPNAQQAGKTLINSLHNRPLSEETLTQTTELIASIRSSEEGREGLTVFLDKRKPTWVKAEDD